MKKGVADILEGADDDEDEEDFDDEDLEDLDDDEEEEEEEVKPQVGQKRKGGNLPQEKQPQK